MTSTCTRVLSVIRDQYVYQSRISHQRPVHVLESYQSQSLISHQRPVHVLESYQSLETSTCTRFLSVITQRVCCSRWGSNHRSSDSQVIRLPAEQTGADSVRTNKHFWGEETDYKEYTTDADARLSQKLSLQQMQQFTVHHRDQYL